MMSSVYITCYCAELNLVDVLYQMLRDTDPLVISNCVTALDEILANEGGMIITKKIAHYLINRYSKPVIPVSVGAIHVTVG